MQSNTDRSRIFLLLTTAAGVIALMLWWGSLVGSGDLGEQGALGRAPGSEVVLSLLRVLSIEGPDDYTIGQGALVVPVRGPTAQLRVGTEVTVGGVVRDGYVQASFVQSAHGRPKKRYLGMAGLLVAAVLAAVSVRLERGGLVLRG